MKNMLKLGMIFVFAFRIFCFFPLLSRNVTFEERTYSFASLCVWVWRSRKSLNASRECSGRIFEPKTDEVIGSWRKLDNDEELHDLFSCWRYSRHYGIELHSSPSKAAWWYRRVSIGWFQILEYVATSEVLNFSLRLLITPLHCYSLCMCV